MINCLFDRPLRALFAVTCCCLILSGCGGHTVRVIETPANKELKGWQKPYEVDGQRYRPLREHYGFKQSGIASWYGKKFHGRLTSNGEVYDMYKMTAAHKTLPLGVHVRVTNKRNGRSITVRVNDRGPFVAGRVIDLSFAAAKQLDIVDLGTAPVEVEALGYRQQGSGQVTYRPPESYDAGKFAVQIGAFSVEANARQLAAQMRDRLGAAEVQPALIKGKYYYRVRAGHFRSLAAAEGAKEKFRRQGYPGSFVVAFE